LSLSGKQGKGEGQTKKLLSLREGGGWTGKGMEVEERRAREGTKRVEIKIPSIFSFF
jgi:hypothetical protein